jgi:hypothetical protein
MSDLIERVAQAVVKEWRDNPLFKSSADWNPEVLAVATARAAAAAMREEESHSHGCSP